MELTCEKYKVKMIESEAECTHLGEHCQFRKACIINFLTRERARELRRGLEGVESPDGSASSE
ncbi:MAG: RNA polymerase II-associated protein [Desulfobulbaceae bacterium]|nr:RNA polymerase II-associated protein [Desulfobulbaceae bacterium]